MSKTKLIMLATLVFLVIISSTLYIAYRLAQKAGEKAYTAPTQSGDYIAPTTQQIRKITLKNVKTGETMELLVDGTINYYDAAGKLKKTARRGFAETQSKFRDLERLINGNRSIGGLDGFVIIIETSQGTIVINPGDQGEGVDIVDDIEDYIDSTLNPTPRPSPSTAPAATPTSIPQATPTPTPIDVSPEPEARPPFNCSDYYKSGKSIKISNIICGETQ